MSRNLLADEVISYLRRAIVSGQIGSGERLRETDLAAQMGVSRGPVHEALIRLQQEGLIILEPHRGAQVAVLSLDDRQKIYSVRSALEQLAGEYACSNATDDDFLHTEQVLNDFERVGEEDRTPALAADWDIRFHDSIYVAAHNEPLYRAWEGLRSQVHFFLTTRMVLRPDFNEVWLPEHRLLLDVLRRRDAAEYSSLISAHIQAGYERIIPEGAVDDSARVPHAG